MLPVAMTRPELQNPKPQSPLRPEEEYSGPIWKHPYLLYILLTAVLFTGLMSVAWLALENDWIPKR